MAVTPGSAFRASAEFVRLREEAEVKRISDIEFIIDNAIVKPEADKSDGRFECTISTEELSHAAQAQLRNKYKAAGWGYMKFVQIYDKDDDGYHIVGYKITLDAP